MTRHILLSIVICFGCLTCYFSSRYVSHHLGDNYDGLMSFSNLDASSSSWFVAHPILGILGAVVLPVPAVILRKYKGYWSKKIHAYVFAASVLSLIACIYIAFVHKDARGKNHFVSLHAKAGSILAIIYVLLSAVGLLALDPDHALMMAKSRKTLLKTLHKSGGRYLLVAGYWICFSGWLKFFDGTVMYMGIAVATVSSFLTFVDPLCDMVFTDAKHE